jgi:CDP-glucose 4,6-dehydratase
MPLGNPGDDHGFLERQTCPRDWTHGIQRQLLGIALSPATEPRLFRILGLEDSCVSNIASINDPEALDRTIQLFRPEVIFHLAAQALVRASYDDPIGTYETNVVGVVRLLEGVRRLTSVRSVVVVTSDKCYENREQIWGYRERDPLGGTIPIGASKGAAEIVARSMQRSFFKPFAPGGHSARIATVRSGNVIGGGDWSHDRLVPDIVRGILGDRTEIHLRNPNSIRPWQHVLEPLSAYLRIAEMLATGENAVDEAWNIGPNPGDARTVLDVARALIAAFGKGTIIFDTVSPRPHETHTLALDCTKANRRLDWHPRLLFEDCIRMTADWYLAWHRDVDMAAFTRSQLTHFERLGT